MRLRKRSNKKIQLFRERYTNQINEPNRTENEKLYLEFKIETINKVKDFLKNNKELIVNLQSIDSKVFENRIRTKNLNNVKDCIKELVKLNISGI